MESISGLSNWQLTLRREPDHIVILRAVTCDKVAVLPGELFGLPVTVLDDHALAPGARPVQGEQLRITCGREAGEWDNRNLEELTLPAGLERAETYALYGCRSLHTLRLHDGVRLWGGGSLMNCRSLRTLHLTRLGERHGESLAFFCDEIHDALEVHLYQPDGSYTRLLFPEFVENYDENIASHHFDYTVSGGGYPYHHVFRGKQLDLRDYDGLWPKYLREEHDPAEALRLALLRLRWPTDLSAGAEKQYWDYLKRFPRAALELQLSQKDAAGLRLLLENLQPESSLLHEICEQARLRGDTEGLALLLERQHKSEPSGFDKEFDL